MKLTAYLIRRRDNAAEAWLRETAAPSTKRRARRRLALWDALLTLWTDHGRRRA